MADKTFIIAVDPGTRDMGLAFGTADGRLLSFDNLHVPTSWKSMRRILAIMELLEDCVCRFIGADETSPAEYHLAYEQPTTFTGIGKQGAVVGRPVVSLHQLVAVLEYWCYMHDPAIKSFAYPVGDIKEGVAGDRSAAKMTVRQIVTLEHRLGSANISEHEIDAVSIMTFHSRQMQLQERVMPR